MRNANYTAALLENRTRVYRRSRMLRDGYTLSGQRCLIQHNIPALQNSVKRQDVPRMDDDPVSRNNDAKRSHLRSIVFSEFPYLIHLQRHASCQIIDRLLVCPFVKNFAYSQQKIDRTGSCIVPRDKRCSDGDSVKHLHRKVPAHSSFYAFNYSRTCPANCKHAPKRIWQQETPCEVSDNKEDQLFLVLPVH